MIRFSVAVAVVFLAVPAQAEVFPVLADVAGVAADDVLNIRDKADPAGAIIGVLAPDATGVEVLAVEGGWALVNSGEGAGYAAVRYLRLDDGAPWYALTAPLACSGTEPFWGLDANPASGTAEFWAADPAETQVNPIGTLWPGEAWAERAAFAMSGGTVVLSPGLCSDGMSDRAYGISVDIFLSDPAGGRYS
ncbi:MAG: hypothetical protein B7Y02_16245, partial [Rhodobacterales bacterium 17-64-5]